MMSSADKPASTYYVEWGYSGTKSGKGFSRLEYKEGVLFFCKKVVELQEDASLKTAYVSFSKNTPVMDNIISWNKQ